MNIGIRISPAPVSTVCCRHNIRTIQPAIPNPRIYAATRFARPLVSVPAPRTAHLSNSLFPLRRRRYRQNVPYRRTSGRCFRRVRPSVSAQRRMFLAQKGWFGLSRGCSRPTYAAASRQSVQQQGLWHIYTATRRPFLPMDAAVVGVFQAPSFFLTTCVNTGVPSCGTTT